jgi:hypothetical protein
MAYLFAELRPLIALAHGAVRQHERQCVDGIRFPVFFVTARVGSEDPAYRNAASEGSAQDVAAGMAVSHPCRFSGVPQNLGVRLLQRIQERKECLLVFCAQFAEALPFVFGLAAVTFNGAF